MTRKVKKYHADAHFIRIALLLCLGDYAFYRRTKACLD